MFTIYTIQNCPWCDKAKDALENKNLEYVTKSVDEDEALKRFMYDHGFTTVPQVYDGDEHIGGYEDLLNHLMEVYS